MSREHATESNEVHDILVARWKGFQRLAKTLPNRHILAVELIRTLKDETIAVFTIARDGEPVRYVVTGDAHGKVVSRECPPHKDAMDFVSSSMDAKAIVDDGAADPASVALGRPPPTEPITPGIVAVGGGLLGAAFDVGELVDTSPK